MSTAAPLLLPEAETTTKHCPRWNVIILNDDHHSIEFVLGVVIQIFKKDFDEAIEIVKTAHETGRAICTTCSKERAELYLEQVSSLKEGAKGAVGCEAEPVGE